MASYVLGAVGVTGCCIAGMSKIFGVEIPIRVTCWFCSHCQTVKFSQRNSWDCNACGQYNGFNKDGDYNKEIHGQHSDIPVNPKTKYATGTRGNENETTTLCDTCNRNQEMKVYQLGRFSPSNPRNEDKELQEYTQHLERTYRLCRECEAKVGQVLGEQDSKLKQKFLSWKLSLFRKSPLISSQDYYPSAELYLSALSRLVLITLAIVIWIASLHDTQFSYIPKKLVKSITPFFQIPQNFGYFELVTVSVPLALAVGYCQSPATSIGSSRRHLFSLICWLTLFLQRVFQLTSFKFELASVSLIFCILSAMSFKSPNKNKEEKIRKKRDKRRKLYEDLNKVDEHESEVEVSDTPISTPVATPNPTPVPSPAATPVSTPVPPQLPQVHLQENGQDFYLPNHEIYQNSNEQCDISTLQINNNKQHRLDSSTLGGFRPESPFSLKSYNAGNESTVDFGDLTHHSRSSFIKPAGFVYNERNRIAQSSWVAGGYWQNQKQNQTQNETLSRSSSQSSGIGSLTSAAGLHKDFLVNSLPNSRVNSTCGGGADYHERFSIFSEPAYNNHNGTFNSTIIARSPPAGAKFRSKSQLGGIDNDHDSDLNSSIGRLSQEAFSKLQPRAKSSPKPSENDSHAHEANDVSFLERKITINISMYSLFLFLSVGFNISLSAYLFTSYMWH